MSISQLPEAPSHTSPFESIRRVTEAGQEFWSSRSFAAVLGYTDYRNFEVVINKARTACFNSGVRVEDHFVDIAETVTSSNGAQRVVPTVYMSRYACYLIIQNADPRKEIVALGQSYFAIQARQQELSDRNPEDESRLLLRNEIRRHNLQLASAARASGVVEPDDYSVFQNHGYAGLYGGLDAKGIHQAKGLKKSQHILDHMGSTELAANLFRATQTEAKLRRDQVKGKEAANQTHMEVGKRVRETIRDLGGTMPEDLPAAESIKKIENNRRRHLPRPRANSQPQKDRGTHRGCCVPRVFSILASGSELRGSRQRLRLPAGCSGG